MKTPNLKSKDSKLKQNDHYLNLLPEYFTGNLPGFLKNRATNRVLYASVLHCLFIITKAISPGKFILPNVNLAKNRNELKHWYKNYNAMALSITCNQKFENLLFGLCNFEIFILAFLLAQRFLIKKINNDDIINHKFWFLCRGSFKGTRDRPLLAIFSLKCIL